MSLKHRLPLIAVTFTSVLCIAISIFSLKSGTFIVFQNLFYFPIIISCFYYKKQGFAISVALSCIYFFLIIAFTSDPMIIGNAVIRVIIFIFIAAVVTALAIARVRAEDALRRSEANYRSVIENIQDVFYRSDAQGDLIMASPSYVTLLGFESLDDCLGKSIAGTIYYDPEKRKELLRELQGKGSVTNYEVVLKRRDGTPVTVETNSHIYFDEAGNIAGVEGTFRDMTERKRAEAEQAELESQNRQLQKSESLGRMAGAIVHHFNNMLQAIMGNIQMAMRIMPQDAGPVKNLTAAMEVAHTAEAISGQMLTYLGQSFDKHESLNLSEICHWSLPMLQAIKPGNVKLETDLPSPGPVISANANQIQQTLTILVTNAWEAVGESPGSIHLSVKTVSQADISASYRYPVDWQPQGNVYACLEVKDMGSGIKGKDIEKIFDPFFSTKFTGRGMGLAVVLGIVRAHGGGVMVESEAGRGSIFKVYFPVSAEELDKATMAPERRGQHGAAGRRRGDSE
jgi:PAS domain S-box-containing protein